MTSDRIRALDQYIEQHVQAYMQELAGLCNQPSVSAQHLGIRECASLVAEMLGTRGIAGQVIETEGHPVVFGEYGTGEHILLLYNHYDVQPPEPLECWEALPFETALRDGKMFARRSSDDKGVIISRLAAFDAMRAIYGDLPYWIKFLIEGEEELGSPSLETFIRTHQTLLAADACVWEAGWTGDEGRLLMYLGLRGVVNVELQLRTLTHDAHSGVKSYLPNAAWRLVWTLSTMKDQHEHILIPGFYDQVQPPSRRQRELLAAVPFQEEQEKKYYGTTRFTGDLMGQALKEAVFLPTCTINGLWSGYQGNGPKTIIPAEAGCKIDFRLVPGQEPEAVVCKLRVHLDAQGFDDIEIVSHTGKHAGIVDPDDPFVQLAVEAASAVYGKKPVVSPLIGGSGPYGTLLDSLRTPIVASGVGYHGSLVHAPNEHIRVSDWLLGTKHMARILAGFSATYIK